MNPQTEGKIARLIQQMTLEEKIGQMTQRNGADGHEDQIRDGLIGSILNEIDTDKLNNIQRIAMKESRMGIPLIIGRDVIHGFRTVFPIPLGLAASWNPELIKQGTRIAAIEAASVGVRWTFAPMMDICRDPRWGRIAETLGEDQYLASVLAVAMVEGFQSDDLSNKDALAACAKHFAGYGAAEGGRDYNTTSIPEQLMRDVYLKPFKACTDAGVATFMVAFNEINGVPASGNSFLLKQILRDEWNFDGFVVSDWASITQMINHGYCRDDKHAAERSLNAGLEMEMATSTFIDHIKNLLDEQKITMQTIDDAVRNILRIKFRLGLFENPYTDPADFPELVNAEHLAAAKESAIQSVVMLKNDNQVLPLSKEIKSIAVIGPMADDQFEQLGTWTYDKNIEDTQTPLMALKKFDKSSAKINYVQTLEYSRAKDKKDFQKAVEAAEKSDAVLMFMGEESILSGEAHCRANIDLPGIQEDLIHEISKTGKPIVLVIMAGRPITIGNIIDKVDAILFSLHPGTMGGPALVDLIFGEVSPSGKLPVTYPKVVGQIPLYYNYKNTGRPFDPKTYVPMDSIPVRAWQTSLGNETHYIDAGHKPLYPFGYGLSYTTFEYSDLKLSSNKIKLVEKLQVSAKITNTGEVAATEIVQLYIRDLVGDITRPVRELKGFERLQLNPGESKTVTFELCKDDLDFHNQKMQLVTEPGKFHVWIGPSSTEGLQGEFEIVQ
ncbi:beta-glucosidase BglX [candidate division KSB1 bacterium]|nr:beta-glucosidase BglX [candidate division KSB1 bacterium]